MLLQQYLFILLHYFTAGTARLVPRRVLFSLTRRSLFGSLLYGDPPGQTADDLKAGALNTANKTVFGSVFQCS